MSNMTKDGVEVRAGQIWRDLDKRMHGRKVIVLAVGDAHARQATISLFNHQGESMGRKVKLSICRMHRPMWELVSEKFA